MEYHPWWSWSSSVVVIFAVKKRYREASQIKESMNAQEQPFSASIDGRFVSSLCLSNVSSIQEPTSQPRFICMELLFARRAFYLLETLIGITKPLTIDLVTSKD
jgi:hypothetical protein